LAVSGFSNVFTNKRDLKVGYLPGFVLDLALPIYQVFLEEFRPRMNPKTMFDLISIDGGINNQLPAGTSISGVNYGCSPC
jgi:hypothetical protein